ncbi:MAG: precorrin-2 C(20)-methyltransferase [Sciscionella sp.]
MRAPRLVGIGVGPGDPELLTIAALREFRDARQIFVPVLDPADAGRAEAVVRAHLGADPKIQRLVFALNDAVDGPQLHRRQRWDSAAEAVVAVLREHNGTAAFATLGDPAVYSTFRYLSASVLELLPEAEIATVPGITAMQAAASAAGISLVEGAEPLTLLPLTRDVEALRRALAGGGTVVAYKGGRRFTELAELIAAAGATDRAVYAEHLGTPDQRVLPLSEADELVAPYLSAVLVPARRNGRGAQL